MFVRGIRIKFEYHIERWQSAKLCNNPLKNWLSRTRLGSPGSSRDTSSCGPRKEILNYLLSTLMANSGIRKLIAEFQEALCSSLAATFLILALLITVVEVTTVSGQEGN